MATSKRKASNVILMGILIITVIYVAVVAPARYIHPPKIDPAEAIVLDPPIAMPEFTLQSDQGQLFTHNNLLGHWTLMYFNFKECNANCIVTINSLNETYNHLKNHFVKAQLPQFLLVMVDLNPSNSKWMKNYIKSLNPNFINVQANPRQSAVISNLLSSLDAKTSDNSKSSANNQKQIPQIVIVDPQANIRAYFYVPKNAVYVASDYMQLFSSFKE